MSVSTIKSPSSEVIQELGTVLLNIGIALMSSGASTSRTRMIVDRVATHYGMEADLFITHSVLTITVSDPVNELQFSRLKRTPPQGVNFTLVSDISRMTWRLKENNWTVAQVEEELKRLKALPHYPRIIVLFAVGFADACFCYFSGGNYSAMGVAMFATIAGLYIKQESFKLEFNQYLCVFFAALLATLLAGLFRSTFPEEGYSAAFASCVLFLIPGVPLINTVTDLFEGNLLNGLIRATHAMLIAFMIALGMTISILIYHF
ncbi:threonine/serine ThrE exporter family protein [Robertkochia solimangrovi]|uniref:threonine/serine ThrE exporter family protein n=1 Tax=Robertkochia solimangrovi TaxID=2213046 RepID=UPI00117C1D22|nr:threonine/serine exporter family protein [Robertkochia solimangrovi]TRZ42146.1 threonine/serine exporter [Robertkochia solimangrovi]